MLKDALYDTWRFFRMHFIPLSAIILPVVLPADILILAYQNMIDSNEIGLSYVVPAVIKLAINPLYSVGVVLYIAYVVKGRVIDTKTAWMLGIQYWVPYFILSVLIGIVTMAGLMMLIIPGIVFLVRFSFAEFDLLLNNAKPADAMKNSWIMTRDYMLEIFLGFAVITVVLFVPYYTLITALDSSHAFFRLVNMAATVIYSVLEVLFTIFAFRVYDFINEEKKNKVFDLEE